MYDERNGRNYSARISEENLVRQLACAVPMISNFFSCNESTKNKKQMKMMINGNK